MVEFRISYSSYICSMSTPRVDEGMKIFSEIPLEGRISLSSGIEEVKEINGKPCFKRAFLPKKPWTDPTPEEMNILRGSKDATNEYQQFALLNIPDAIRDQFHALKVYECTNYQDADRVMRTPAYAKVLNEFLEHFKPWHKGDEPPVPHSIYIGEAGLTTTTFNRQENFFIGIHLDSFERKPMNERHIARNRICINLGKQPRYLLFINLEYRQLVKKAGFHDNFVNEPHHHHYEALYKFYEKFPDYPVLRLKIDPYEAYLAPTENVVHDGTTEGCTTTDINLAVRGYYQRGESLMKPKTPEKKSFFKSLFGK